MYFITHFLKNHSFAIQENFAVTSYNSVLGEKIQQKLSKNQTISVFIPVSAIPVLKTHLLKA